MAIWGRRCQWGGDLLSAMVVATCLVDAVVAGHNPGTPWPATDALGRQVAMPDTVGLPRPDRFVGIFYFTWHNQRGGRNPHWKGPNDVSKVLAADPDALSKPDSPLWGSHGTYHYWGEPLFGYYLGTDRWVLRRHAHLLADAGIDVIIVDATNALTYRDVYTALCDVFRHVRQEGGRTPQIAFMLNTRARETAQKLYRELYEPQLYRELWFEWRGKPLMICDPEKASPEVAKFFTLRRAHWPFEQVNTQRAWHWEATYPQPFGYTDDPNVPEQVNVSVAQNLRRSDGQVTNMSQGNARGRSFHDGHFDRTPGAILHGHNCQEQWRRAHALAPPFVMVTGWNEWIAGRFRRPGLPIVFVDQFDQEFSRDIEPMRGGHGDNYYWQLVSNVRQYKGSPPLPASSAPATFNIEQPFDRWRNVGPEFLDHLGETVPRDFDGSGGLHYTNRTGRNDLVLSKVARDHEYVYFYAQTRQPITASTGAHWMCLFLDIDQNAETGWEGFDFIVNRTVESERITWLERNTGGWEWKRVARIGYRAAGNEIQLAIPRRALGRPADSTRLAIDFQWVDHLQRPGDILDFYQSGDAAPEGRFRYRYVAP